MAERVGISPVMETAAAEPASDRAPRTQRANRGVDPFLRLQQAIGNRATRDLLSTGLLQTKLKVGSPNDKYEQEADRVAEQVIRMPAGDVSILSNGPQKIQRQCGSCSSGEGLCPQCAAAEEEKLQRKPLTATITPLIQRQVDASEIEQDKEQNLRAKAAPSETAQATSDFEGHLTNMRGGGTSLSQSQRRFFEPRFGHDFSQVRIHADNRAVGLARSINAEAFTLGQDVVFGAGQYQPHSIEGQRLIAHELTHVVQQSGNRTFGYAGGFERQGYVDNKERVQQRTGPTLQGAWSWGGAGVGALIGGAAGGLLGAIFGPVGALIGAGAGALIGGVIGGLIGGKSKVLTDVQRKCARLMAKIRQHPVYRALAKKVKKIADDIMAVAQKRTNCLYYAEKLKLLLDTPEAPPAVSGEAAPQGSTLERNRDRVGKAVTKERARLATPKAQQEVGRQEQVADEATRSWTPRRGRQNKIFYVDNSDPNNIVIRIKLRLLRGGSVTTQQDVDNLIFLEDAIERVAETKGYTMDVIFTSTNGPDVFTYNVDFDKWPTSGNPVGNARTLAHEIHHLIGLKDRYDYIEAHAANKNMNIPKRLHWFREQMNRQPDPEGAKSLMGKGKTMLDDDICRVSGLDFQDCMKARKGDESK